MSQSLEHSSSDNQHVVKGSEVFVGGLPRTVTEDKINEVFSSCGKIVEIRLIKDQKGSLKGFCFVRFSSKAAADKAVKEKSGILLDGKKIGVLPSVEQDTLFMGNLFKGWTADEFDVLVRQVFPDVVSVELAMPFSSGETPPGQKKQNRGFAFVKFSSHAAAARAHRAATSPEFLLAGKLHPAVAWAEEEHEVDPEELAKVKIAFIRNLPTGADENFLMKLFAPLGKVEKVVVSKKARSPVGFIHFADRSNLDNAIREMNGKTIQGPNGGPSFKLLVEVARPTEKSKKRVREDLQSNQPSTVTTSKLMKNDEAFNTIGGLMSATQQEPLADPYEAAVVLLPVAVKERLLRILRLGIANRYDIDIECLTSLKDLPDSTAISVLDQFMLSGSDKINKGAYLTSLISRHQINKLGDYGLPSSLSRVGDISTEKLELSSFSSRSHLPAYDSIASRIGLTAARSDGKAARYSYLYSDYPLSSRTSFGRFQEASSVSSHQTAGPSAQYAKIGLDSSLLTTAGYRQQVCATGDREPARPQIRFDPFTGEPYKFDPFTGEPIRPPDSPARHFKSPY